ncbi:MAG: Holliday junction branch migration protein RuvA [Pseudomonadota bacterium]
MISQLRGVILSQRPPWLELDVHGVGYELELPLSAFCDMPAVGESCHLYTHLVVREDAQLLYGFASEAERDLFRTLLRVTGVGAKMALACLSALTAEQLCQAIHSENVARLATVPGIGRKTAQRMVLELRDKLGPIPLLPGAAPAAAQPHNARDEAIAALVALGYKPAQAGSVVQGLADDLSTEQYIRLALQGLAK